VKGMGLDNVRCSRASACYTWTLYYIDTKRENSRLFRTCMRPCLRWFFSSIHLYTSVELFSCEVWVSQLLQSVSRELITWSKTIVSEMLTLCRLSPQYRERMRTNATPVTSLMPDVRAIIHTPAWFDTTQDSVGIHSLKETIDHRWPYWGNLVIPSFNPY
jgi:hypothetical protein